MAGASLAAFLPGATSRASADCDSLEQAQSLKYNAPGRPLFGLVAPAARLSNERGYFARMADEMSLFTLESDFQWSTMEPRPGEWDFRSTDEGVQFARSHGTLFAGHALYYHYFIPQWLRASSDADALTQALQSRIETTMTRYRGSIFRWDVVNEPLNARDGLSGGLRATSFSRTLGERYIDLAFRSARAADPAALLCLNEAEFEYGDQQAKRDDLLALLRRLKDRGAPVDVLGIQSHLSAAKTFDFDSLRSFLTQVRALGLKVAVTELDVVDETLPADPSVRDRLVADHAQGYLRTVHDNSELIGVTCWGYSDRFTWLDMWHKRADGRPLRPLPFDFDLMRKPLWRVIRETVSA